MEQLMDIRYSELDIELRKMDVFVPGDNANGIGLLFIHGGGWHGGARKSWHPVANYFCEKGFSCASTSYRLAPDAQYPSQIEDVRLAMSYFLENAERFRFDASRTVALGSSAGGHLSAMLATIAADDELGVTPELRIRDTRPQAAVLYCPATNMRVADNFENLRPSIERLFGQAEADIPQTYAQGSPIERIDGREPPTLLIHGDDDKVIPLEHSAQYRDKLAAHGVPAELVVLPGVPHGFGYGVETRAQQDSLREIERFLAARFAD